MKRSALDETPNVIGRALPGLFMTDAVGCNCT